MYMGNNRVSLFKIIFENLYVRLNQAAVKNIENKLKEKKIKDKNLFDILHRIKKNQKISLKNLDLFIKKLKLERDSIEKKIILITSVKNTNKGIKNPNLPLTFNNVETATLLGGILGDGHLCKTLTVGYSNQSKDLIDKISICGKKVFGNIDERLHFRKDNTYHLFWPKAVGILIFHMGVIPGHRTKSNPEIPSIIENGTKRMKAAFLRQYFDDEGNVRLKDRRLQIKQTIEIKNNLSKEKIRKNIEKFAPNMIKSIKKILNSFEIRSNISLALLRTKGNISKSDWELSIYGKENLINFKKYIGFELKEKQKKLNCGICSYKFPSAPRNKKYEFALKKAKLVQNKNGFIDKLLLAKECDRTTKTANSYLMDLNKNGLVKQIEKKKSNGPYKYRLP